MPANPRVLLAAPSFRDAVRWRISTRIFNRLQRSVPYAVGRPRRFQPDFPVTSPANRGTFTPDSFSSQQHLAMRITLALLALFACVPLAHADAMRCGSKLIREGDTRSLVRDFCGEPSDIQTQIGR